MQYTSNYRDDLAPQRDPSDTASELTPTSNFLQQINNDLTV